MRFHTHVYQMYLVSKLLKMNACPLSFDVVACFHRVCVGPLLPDDYHSQYFIDVILARHARKMLSGGNLRDLGSFVAYLEFPLKTWLAKERYYIILHCVVLLSVLKPLSGFDWLELQLSS